MLRGNPSISGNSPRVETDRDGTTAFALLRLDRTFVSHRSKCSTSSKTVPRRAGCKFPKQAEACQAPGFAETISCRKNIFHRRGRREHRERRSLRQNERNFESLALASHPLQQTGFCLILQILSDHPFYQCHPWLSLNFMALSPVCAA